MNRPIVLTISLFALVAMMLAACGGDGDSGGPSGAPRLTDPATVPVAERVGEDRTYVLRDSGVIAPSGSSATLPTDNGGTSATPSGPTYTVEPGDSCGAIAARLGVTLDQLLSANPQIDAECRNLIPGQELRVPGADAAPTPTGGEEPSATDPTPTPPPATGSGESYVIQPGDICISIANQFGVDVDELIALNNLDCNRLQPGETITIP